MSTIKYRYFCNIWTVLLFGKIYQLETTTKSSQITIQRTSDYGSSRSQMFFKAGVLKNFANFTGNHLNWSLFLTKLQTFRPATLLKGNSSTGIFLRKLQNFKKQLFFT